MSASLFLGNFPVKVLYHDVFYMGKMGDHLDIFRSKGSDQPALPAAFFQDNPLNFVFPCIIKQSAQ